MTNKASSVEAHLIGLNDVARANILQAQRHGGELGKLLQLDLDIMAWEQELAGRPEVAQLSSARRELGFALYAASAGLYLHAYAGLRLFLELSFASVHFSANELHRRRWIADRADFSWSAALDAEDGVLSKRFVQEFNSSAAERCGEFAKTAARSYRHCSQFIHGKLAATRSLPDSLAYSNPVLTDWLRTAVDSATSVLFLIYARYGDELLTGDALARLTPCLESSFGHVEEVRKRLGLPVEADDD